MAFTGVAVIQQISDRCVRVTGLSLAGAAAGVIALAAGTTANAVLLPASFKPAPYTYNPTANNVSFIESIRVTMNVVDAVTTLVPISVVKTGTTEAAFAITFTNDTAATLSAGLEIYIEFRD